MLGGGKGRDGLGDRKSGGSRNCGQSVLCERITYFELEEKGLHFQSMRPSAHSPLLYLLFLARCVQITNGQHI